MNHYIDVNFSNKKETIKIDVSEDITWLLDVWYYNYPDGKYSNVYADFWDLKVEEENWNIEIWDLDHYKFLNFVKECVNKRLFWPMLEDFIKEVVQANNIWVITSRWHSQINLKRWFKYLLTNVLKDEEKEEFIENYNKKYWKTEKNTFNHTMFKYLYEKNKDNFYAVSHNSNTYLYHNRNIPHEDRKAFLLNMILKKYKEENKYNNLLLRFSDNEEKYLNSITRLFKIFPLKEENIWVSLYDSYKKKWTYLWKKFTDVE